MDFRLALALLFLSAPLITASQDYCRVMAMSGGGNRASYQAGAIYTLVQNLDPSEVTWDVVSGVSGGAMNAARMSTFEVGDEKAMAETLKGFWHELEREDIWILWEGGLFEGIFNQSGVFNTTPFDETFKDIFKEPVRRQMVVSSVDSKTGIYHPFDETTPQEDLHTVTLASGAVPAVFPSKHYLDHVLIDGGTVWNTNFEAPIQKCLEQVESPEQVIVDIAICQHTEKLEPGEQNGNTLENLLRYREINQYYRTLDDLYEFAEANPDVNFRYIFVPSEDIPGGLQMLDFGHDATDPIFEVGVKDAEKMLGLGEQVGINRLKEWKNSKELQEKFENFKDYLYS